MASAPAHQFGQMIGEVLETAVTPLLEEFAKQHELYLDKKGERSCRAGKKCSWLDLNGNTHDLDYVLERGGTADRKGIPQLLLRPPGGGIQSIQETRHRKFKAQSSRWSKHIATLHRFKGQSSPGCLLQER